MPNEQVLPHIITQRKLLDVTKKSEDSRFVNIRRREKTQRRVLNGTKLGGTDTRENIYKKDMQINTDIHRRGQWNSDIRMFNEKSTDLNTLW